MALANLSIYYTSKNIKSAYNNNTFKISAPTWNDKFDFPHGSYSIADIQDCFEFIIKKYETLTENSPVQIYPNKIKSRIVFEVKTGYKLELLINIAPHSLIMLRTTNTEFSSIKVRFTDQNSEPLETEDSANLTLIFR